MPMFTCDKGRTGDGHRHATMDWANSGRMLFLKGSAVKMCKKL